MLNLKMRDLDCDTRMIVQDVCIRLLKRMTAELQAAEKEADSEEEPAPE